MSRLAAARRVPVWVWLVAGVAGLVLTGVALVVEVRVVIVSPALGDVSAVVGAVTTVLLVFATLASFALAVYSLVGEETEGPSRSVTLAGENNDYTVYIGFDEEHDGSSEADGNAAIQVPANETGSSDAGGSDGGGSEDQSSN